MFFRVLITIEIVICLIDLRFMTQVIAKVITIQRLNQLFLVLSSYCLSFRLIKPTTRLVTLTSCLDSWL